MNTRRLGLIVLCTSWALAAILAVPRPAAAQCSMSGGGHDHSAMHSQGSRKAPASQKKLQQSVDRVLSDDAGRAILADALLNDRAFMEDLIQRLATIPEWRTMALTQLAPRSAGDSTETTRPQGSSAAAPLYVCPMHPEVTSSKPGECPKCGMQLERAAPDRK